MSNNDRQPGDPTNPRTTSRRRRSLTVEEDAIIGADDGDEGDFDPTLPADLWFANARNLR